MSTFQFVVARVEAGNNFKMEIVVITCLQYRGLSVLACAVHALITAILFSLKKQIKEINPNKQKKNPPKNKPPAKTKPQHMRAKESQTTSCLALWFLFVGFFFFLWAEVFNSVFYLDCKLSCTKNIQQSFLPFLLLVTLFSAIMFLLLLTG